MFETDVMKIITNFCYLILIFTGNMSEYLNIFDSNFKPQIDCEFSPFTHVILLEEGSRIYIISVTSHTVWESVTKALGILKQRLFLTVYFHNVQLEAKLLHEIYPVPGLHLIHVNNNMTAQVARSKWGMNQSIPTKGSHTGIDKM